MKFSKGNFIKTCTLLLPAALYLALGIGCSGATSFLTSSGGSGATGSTPADKIGGGSSSGGGDSNGNDLGSGDHVVPGSNLGSDGNSGSDSSGNQAQAMARANTGGANYTGGVGLGNEGFVGTAPPKLYALVIPPSGTLNNEGCQPLRANRDNYVGDLPVVVVSFSASPDGPSEHFERYPTDSCGLVGIQCFYNVYDEKGVSTRISRDFVRLQAFYTAKGEDLFFPYNIGTGLPPPFNIMEHPDLTGKYQSDMSQTFDCRKLKDPYQIEALALHIPPPPAASEMLMPPR